MNVGKGYLTYGLAAVGVVWAISGFAVGLIDMETASMVLWASLAIFGIRRAIQ